MKCHSFMDALLIKHTHVRPHMADNLKIHPDLNLKVKIPNGFNPFTLCGYLEQVSANMVMTNQFSKLPHVVEVPPSKWSVCRSRKC